MAFRAGFVTFMQKQTGGYKTYWKIIPQVAEKGPAKFGKKPIRISGVLNKFGGTVFRIFQRHFKGAFSAKGSFYIHKASDAAFKTRKGILLMENIRKKGPEYTSPKQKKDLGRPLVEFVISDALHFSVVYRLYGTW